MSDNVFSHGSSPHVLTGKWGESQMCLESPRVPGAGLGAVLSSFPDAHRDLMR